METETKSEQKEYTVYYEGRMSVLAASEDDASSEVYDRLIQGGAGEFQITGVDD